MGSTHLDSLAYFCLVVLAVTFAIVALAGLYIQVSDRKTSDLRTWVLIGIFAISAIFSLAISNRLKPDSLRDLTFHQTQEKQR